MSGHTFEINDDATGVICTACLSGEWFVDPSMVSSSTTSSYDGSSVQVVLALPATGAATASADEVLDCTASSYVGSSVQVVLALPAAGGASADEVLDCTSEEKDFEANAIPPLFVSPEKTENPGGPETTLGAEPLNLLSLIDENYFCPEASYRSLQMKCRALQETGQKEVIQNSVGVMGKGMVETTEAPHSDLTYLFEKELTASDCDVNIGQLMIPRSYVEAYFLTPDQRGTSIRITDIEGKVWSFELLSCAYTNNRTHVLGGTLKCIREMQWEIGDTLKFYRNELDGKIVMELKKIDTGAPSK